MSCTLFLTDIASTRSVRLDYPIIAGHDEVREMSMAGDDLVLDAEDPLDEGVAHFVATIPLHSMRHGLQAVSGDEDPHVDMPQQRHICPFDDHDLHAFQVEAFGRN